MEKVAIIGMGTMGSAMRDLLEEKYEVVGIGRDCEDLRVVSEADAVIMAVKPQSFADTADRLWMHMRDEQLVISIMAGITLRALRRRLGNDNVVRTMPNLGLAQGQSLTAWYANRQTDTTQAEAIIGMWGADIQLEDETQFHAFTALAGSGPAYFFELARTLEVSARQYGFTPAQARLIGTRTLLSTASVVGSETDLTAQVQRVASKGGTTEAALTVLRQRGFEQMVDSAIETACERSRELGRK